MTSKLVHAMVLVALCIFPACATKLIREFPGCLDEQCYGALNYAQDAMHMESDMTWRVFTEPAKGRNSRGEWWIISPEGKICGGWTDSGGRRSVIAANPANPCEVNQDTLLHEAAHHVLLANRISGHPQEYKHLFADWRD